MVFTSVHIDILSCSNWLQQNSINLKLMRPDRCHILEYSRISDSTYTDLSSYSKFLLLQLHLGCITNQRRIYFGYLLQLLVFSNTSVLFCVFWSLHSWWSLCSRRQWVRRYHCSWCKDNMQDFFEHVPEICLFQSWSSALVKKQNFQVLILLSSNVRLSPLLDCQTSD